MLDKFTLTNFALAISILAKFAIAEFAIGISIFAKFAIAKFTRVRVKQRTYFLLVSATEMAIWQAILT